MTMTQCRLGGHVVVFQLVEQSSNGYLARYSEFETSVRDRA